MPHMVATYFFPLSWVVRHQVANVRQEEAAKKQEVAAEQSIVIAREKELADSALMEALPAVEAAAQVRQRDPPTGISL